MNTKTLLQIAKGDGRLVYIYDSDKIISQN